jgi:hypothetical protein
MRLSSLVQCAAYSVLLSACAHHDADALPLPYKPNSTTLIGGGSSVAASDVGGGAAGMSGSAGGKSGSGSSGIDAPTPIVVGTPDSNDCVDLDTESGDCVQPQRNCGDNGTADVLLDDSGAVIDVICYPTDGVSVEAFEGDVHDLGNNVVLVFDNADDGADVTGDVTVDGNNVTLWGYGPDTSVLAGDLHIDKNNSVVRGIRVQGDVVIDKNNPSLVDCVIEGDLTIRGNNVSVALCEVWGKLTIEGENAVLVANEFATAPEVSGKGLRCASNVAFEDRDHDHVLDTDEIGGPIVCGDKEVKAK